MKTSHKIILALSKTLLVFSMGIFVLSLIFLAIVGKPDQTKTWVRDSGLYESLAQTFRKQLIQDNADLVGNNTTLVTDAVNKSLTATQIQNFAEQGIDSTYSWLEGDVAEPTFKLNTDEIKQTFADNLTANLKARAATLPACTYANPPQTNDIATINCIPPGTDVDAEIAQLRQQIVAADTSQISNQVSDVNNQLDGTSQTSNSPFAGLSSMRMYYRWIQLFPLLSGIIFIVAAALIALFSKPRLRALHTIGVALIPYGILYLLSGLLLPQGIKGSFEALVKQGTEDDSILVPLQKIAGNIAELTGTYMLWIGGLLTLLGIILLVAYRLLKKPEQKAPVETPNTGTKPL